MSTQSAPTHTLVIEREFSHTPEKLWRALTDPTLVAQWLMNNDFQPEVGRPFQFRHDPVPNWDGIIDCEVLEVEPPKSLSYTWTSMGLATTVLYTLIPTHAGTRLRLEQSGFPDKTSASYKGAQWGWNSFLNQLLGVVDALG